MADWTNEERREHAFRAVLAFSHYAGDPEDFETSAVDLVADILHLIDHDYSMTAEDVCRIALMHFRAEQDTDAEPEPWHDNADYHGCEA